jgi:predicted component of type VI protein secretion system
MTATDDDEEIDYEEFEELTEEQQEEAVAREWAEFSKEFSALTFEQQIAASIRTNLRTLLNCRKAMVQFPFLHKQLKETQRRLLKYRLSRQAGRWLGEA